MAAEARPRYRASRQFGKIGPPVAMLGNRTEIGGPPLLLEPRSLSRRNPAMWPDRRYGRITVGGHIFISDINYLIADTLCRAQAWQIGRVINLAQFADIALGARA